jgi:hypothetical protein
MLRRTVADILFDPLAKPKAIFVQACRNQASGDPQLVVGIQAGVLHVSPDRRRPERSRRIVRHRPMMAPGQSGEAKLKIRALPWTRQGHCPWNHLWGLGVKAFRAELADAVWKATPGVKACPICAEEIKVSASCNTLFYQISAINLAPFHGFHSSPDPV